MTTETHNSSPASTCSSDSSVYIEPDDDRRVFCGCAGANRYGILALALCYLAFMMSSLIAYNATFVAMLDKTTSPLYNGSTTAEIDWASSELSIGDRRLSFGVMEKSLTFAGGFCGAMLFTFPVNMLLQRFGAHKVMTVIGALCTIMVAITPVIVCWSFPVFVIVRIISGVSISNSFPVAGAVVNEWATTREKGLFVAVLSAYVELSALFTMPISGLIATKGLWKFISWDTVFYLHAALLGLFTVLWAIYYRNLVECMNCVFIGTSLRNIHLSLVKNGKKISLGKRPTTGKTSLPLQRILRSMVIWAIWIAVIGNFLVAQFTISYSPLYLSYVLGFPTMTAGFVTIAPLAGQLVIKMLTGLASDRLTCLPEVGKLRLFNSIALLGSGLFFILLSVIPPTGNAADVVLIIIPVALLGFSSGGYPKCVVMVSQQHSPFVMSIVQIVACLSLLTGSFAVPALTKDDTFDQWRTVFLIYAFVLTLSNTIFIAFARFVHVRIANRH
ncbi:transporter, major facilitator family protein [Ancylostoma caninum]|uniref:Transporter, major facilitator family protein n=1 Tax=Ancylostoma caninum TaxID=29170 RepID=A0A368FJ66_ANCCA|nr:transporter, major facilitator family protein [Ancylostoma caninum]